MTTNAKLYVTALLVLGLCVLTMNFAHWRLADPVRFSFFFFFACAASIMKVAAPAMAGKMSFNFIFVLIGLTSLSLPETLLVGCASVVIECVWRPNSRTTLLEVFFSIANMAVAIACANVVDAASAFYGLCYPLNSLSSWRRRHFLSRTPSRWSALSR